VRSTPFGSSLGCALRGSLRGIVAAPSNERAGYDSFEGHAMIALPHLVLHKDLMRAGANGTERFAIATTTVARSHHTPNISHPKKVGR